MEVRVGRGIVYRLAGGAVLLTLCAGAAVIQETVRYGYDALGRVAWVSYGNGQTIRYDYDPAGNRLVVQTATEDGGFPPMAMHDFEEARVSQTKQLYVLTNDFSPEGYVLRVTARTVPSGGAATIATGGTHLTYVAPGTPGDYYFSYTISDGHGGTDDAAVQVHVKMGQGYCNQFPDDPWC